MMDIVAARTLNFLYIYIDIAWLVALLLILLFTKRYMAIIAGLIGGVIYFLVDWGIFYMLLHTRVVQGADPATFLLWLSMSYGFTNFVWIWVWLDRDGHALGWSVLFISGWLAEALLAQNFGAGFATVSIHRGTADYHGVMALLLVIGYAILVLLNIKKGGIRGEKIKIGWILVIGVLVQFAWEAVLLITGIRPVGVMPLIVNSLLETNMGLPYLYLIHLALTRRRGENLIKIENS